MSSKLRLEDQDCQKVVDQLHEANSKLQKALEIHPSDCIIAIFFHEVICFSTSAYLNRMSVFDENHRPIFPFVDNSYLKDPDLSYWNEGASDQLNTPSFQAFYKNLLSFIFFLSTFSARGKKPSIWVEAGSLSLVNICKLTISGYKLGFPSSNSKKFLPKLDEQVIYLRCFLEKIFSDLKIETSKKSQMLAFDIFISKLLNFIEVKPSTAEMFPGYYVTLCLAELPRRILAAKCRQWGAKVISQGHGVNSTVGFDEPYVGYGELSFCDVFYDYGGWTKGLGYYQRTVCGGIPLVIGRDCDELRRRYNKKIGRLSKQRFQWEQLLSGKLLYIPNAFSASQRYGPFRDIEDSTYLRWQKSLTKEFNNLVYKTHPRNVLSLHGYLSVQSIDQPLSDIDLESNYSAVILDYFGTAHAEICASRLPVIYFNLGLRNILPEALETFKTRVIWFDVNLDMSFDDQLAEFKKQSEDRTFELDLESFTLKDSMASRDTSKTTILDIFRDGQ